MMSPYARQLENYIGVATDLLAIKRRQHALNSEFLASIGMNWEQARALNDEGREALQKQYSEWIKGK